MGIRKISPIRAIIKPDIIDKEKALPRVLSAVLKSFFPKLIEKNVAPPIPNSTPVAIMIRLIGNPIVIPAIPFKPKF